MNEENNVKEPIYLTYGSDLIDLLAFLNNAANDLENYLSNQPWSAKRKDLFRKAYVDIMNGGVTGATNTSGQWQITHNGDIDLSSKSQKEREMYGEAAYYIQQQMSKIPTKQNEEKLAEEEKKELPLFDNEFFTSGLQDYIGNNMFGGRNWSTTDDWNILDERGENGLRGTSVRSKKLAEMLLNYSNTLEEGKYNFEGSPFKNLTDFKSRINNAISALNNDDPNDDRDALNAIGLRANDFLYDGSGDIADTEGHTYSQLALAIQAQNEADAKAKEAQELALTEANRKANSGVLDFIGGIHGTDARTNPQAYAEYISKNLGVGLQGFNEMNKAVQGLIEKGYNNGKGGGLTNAEKRQLGNFLYYIRQNNPNVKSGGWKISNLEWTELSKHKNLGSTNRDKYVRLPWQTSDGRYTYADDKGNVYFLKPLNQAKINGPAFNRSAAYNDYKNNFLKSTSAMNTQEREKYLKSSKDGLTSAEWEELASIGFDIASIVDPEMISSAGLALTGSGLRHHAAASLPGGMSTSDKWWQAADYGLSILGSIPVLGDAALLARATNNLKKAIVPLGLVMAGANVPQAAKAAYNKVVNGLDLTIQDWRAIGAVLTAAVGVGRGRLMSKRAEALRRTGGNTSKTTKEGVIKTSEGKIKVDEATAKLLKELFKGADSATRTQKLRQNTKVLEAARLLGVDLSKAEVLGHGRFSKSPISYTPSTSTTSGNRVATLRAMSEFNKNHGWLARKGLAEQDWVFRHTGGYTSNPHRGLWQSVKDYFGKSKWDDFGLRQSTEQTSTTTNQGNTSPEAATPSANREQQFNRAAINRYKDILNGKFSNKEIKEGSFKFGDGKDVSVSVKKTPTGLYDIYINGKKTEVKNDLNKTEVKKEIASLIQNYRRQINSGKSKDLKLSTKEMGKILLNLKRKGWLKQGGTIDKQKIQRYKNYINK